MIKPFSCALHGFLFCVLCFVFVFLLGEWVGAYLMLGAYW